MSIFANHALFNQSLLDTRLANEKQLYIREDELKNANKTLSALIKWWETAHAQLLKPLSVKDKDKPIDYVPTGFGLLVTSESEVEQGLIRKTLELMGYEHLIANNRALARQKGEKNNRPDMILFASHANIEAVSRALSEDKQFNGRDFCRAADFILEAKKTSEQLDNQKYINQLHGYLRDYDKAWGVLSNGLSWRLYHRNSVDAFFEFHLGIFLTQFVGKNAIKPDDEAVKTFALFERLFGKVAHAKDFLADLYTETEKSIADLREVLKRNAHAAVEKIAIGFWHNSHNRAYGLSETPSQPELDFLREQSLILLYRLLFVLKAESRGLLPLVNDKGEKTPYTEDYALSVILADLESRTQAQLERSWVYQNRLMKLFSAIDQGDSEIDIPVYNGGLFDSDTHQSLAQWRMTDGALKEVLTALMYADKDKKRHIVWKELDVRDLGDVYEGLLELRLIFTDASQQGAELLLRNEKGERKASGSYFTPDSLVTRVTEKTLLPLLEACGTDPNKVLQLNVLDPAMGSGHFLVKAVDVMAQYLTMHCDPTQLTNPDKGVKNTNDSVEKAYWKRKVVESCIYGVDYNPMSVELAKVALWLHTAEYGKVLSFLAHHLKVGNALLGANIDELSKPALVPKASKTGNVWQVKLSKEQLSASDKKKQAQQATGQLDLLFGVDETLMSSVLAQIKGLLLASTNEREDVQKKRAQYKAISEKLKAHKLLADLWCAQWFFVQPDDNGMKAYGEHGNGLYQQLLRICQLQEDNQRISELEKYKNNAFVKQIEANTQHGYGPRPTMFFHWQLEFPEVAFDDKGHAKPDYGFDAVIGNPPWDKIKPESKPFYAPYEPSIIASQGTSTKQLIHQTEQAFPHLVQAWQDYEQMLENTNRFLRESGHYAHQVALVDGKKTGGDPDLYRYFIERAFQCVRDKGRVGLVTPAALWQAEGTTALRQLLFSETQLEEVFSFENFRKWAFEIHTSFKFTSFVFQKGVPAKDASFNAGFMLRNDSLINDSNNPRLMKLNLPLVQVLSPDTLAMLDFKSAGDKALIEKLHQNFIPFGKSDWQVKYRCELHMTNDAHFFKTLSWLLSRGVDASTLTSQPASWYTDRCDDYLPRLLTLKDKSQLSVFIHQDDVAQAAANPHLSEAHFYIVPNETYVPLYEGRMVHIFDHCQKRYVSGEGRTAIWEDLAYSDKTIAPRVYVSMKETELTQQHKLGFCDVTGATNERSSLSCLLPKVVTCGHSVPTLTFAVHNDKKLILLSALFNSFIFDFLIRLRVSLHLTMNFLTQIPVPQFSDINEILAQELCERVVKLSCTTVEMASYWNEIFPASPWTAKSAVTDLAARAVLRAEIDARIAKLYGLSAAEYARVLTHFPLLDRSYKPLAGDLFKPEGTDKPQTDRAFITRDFALHTYIRYLRECGESIGLITDLERFYREQVGLDHNSEESRFTISNSVSRDLEARIQLATDQGQIGYVVS